MQGTEARSLERLVQEVQLRTQAEAALAAERQQLISIFNSAEEAIYVADPDTHEVLFANQALRQTWGEVEGRPCHELLQGQPTPCPHCSKERILGEQRDRTHVWEARNQRNGRWYRCLNRAVRWFDGRWVRLQMAVDIHDRKVLEERTAELELFAHTVSHDLQEPLRLVATCMESLLAQGQRPLDAAAERRVGEAVAGVQRMRGMIRDLLAYARAGTEGMRLETVDPETALLQAQLNLQVAITECNATITHDRLPAVRGDLTQLAQLLQNLIENALKFRGQETPRVHVSATRRNGQWCFSVTDNGLGLDPERASQAFVLFRRLHPEQAQLGHGVGLALCKRIVERHGGRIWVESTPGEGSTFRFTLPVASGPGGAAPAE